MSNDSAGVEVVQ